MVDRLQRDMPADTGIFEASWLDHVSLNAYRNAGDQETADAIGMKIAGRIAVAIALSRDAPG